jgi:HrpA-like RNA helicase
VDEAAGNEETHSGMLTQQHIDVFRQMQSSDSNSAVMKLLKDPSWRPVLDDIPASYLIERAIATAFALNADSPMMRRFGPSKMFDQYKFHAFLWALRGGDGAVASRLLTPSTLMTPAGALESAQATKEQAPPEPPERVTLPIDEFEDIILEKIRNNRVSIIQGETGCGKSSRIPIMILKAPPPVPALGKVKLFISQPRRIAAKALVERVRSVEPDLKDAVALRMGHGVREYETKKTHAWFVTTGYLVRLLINHPEKFNGISHLIIDEVHERSVDTDILCLLCRRLLKTNEAYSTEFSCPTLAAAMYQEYFGVPEPPIKVGARRFPVKEVYLEDLVKTLALPSKENKNIQALVKECDGMKGTRAPSMSYMEKLFSVVANIAMVVGRPGSSVLVFVPGMNEIVAITELVEQLFVPGVRYTCFPIHSEIPFEDQMNVFESTAADEVKIIVATNSAESSVTLPDVDHVVCLGLCKQIVYNEASHRQMLLPTWISRASATQRAGRTGRLRPGTVYRMYTRDTHDKHMEAFEPGEMLRIPLDSVILMLKEMLSDEDVTAVLLDCLEPPDIATIDRSFKSLFSSHFIDTPDDSCEITTLGKFVSALGIDLTRKSWHCFCTPLSLVHLTPVSMHALNSLYALFRFSCAVGPDRARNSVWSRC